MHSADGSRVRRRLRCAWENAINNGLIQLSQSLERVPPRRCFSNFKANANVNGDLVYQR